MLSVARYVLSVFLLCVQKHFFLRKGGNVTSSVPIVFWYIFVLVVSFGVRDLCAGSECEGHKTVQFSSFLVFRVKFDGVRV